jgi:Plasma-membrane choline transporter
MNGSNTGTHITLNQHTAFLLLFVTAAGLVFSIIYLILVRAFTKIIMHITLIMSVLFNVRYSRWRPFLKLTRGLDRYMCLLLDNEVLLYVHDSTTKDSVSQVFRLAGAVIFTVIALFSVLAYFGYRERIPLATLFLRITMDIAKNHTSVYVVGFGALIIQAALSVWFTFTAIATYAFSMLSGK